MKRTLIAAIMVFVTLAQTGCGDGGSNAAPIFVTSILSDSAIDGDIAQNSLGAFTVTQGMSPTVQSVFAGIDPVTRVESRAFLDFPLTTVPVDAVISSAFLDIFIDSIQPPGGTIPIRIDLVSFQSPLVGTDFDRTILLPQASITIFPPISPADVGHHVSIDVTALMREAQFLRLAHFQLRILEDSGVLVPPPGLIEINDTTGANRGLLAPLLQVTFF
jgi:hypothetical protein